MRRPTRQTRRAILLVTNGRVTERQYLNEVVRRANSAVLRVKIQVIAKEPETMLKELTSPKGDVSGYDEIWLIFDEDGHDQSAVVETCARKTTRRQTWGCVVSRPCFEVWLIAHYEQVRNYAHQREAQQHFAQLTGRSTGDKHLPQGFPFDQMQQACSRCCLPGDARPDARLSTSGVGTDMPILLMHLGVVSGKVP